MSENAVELMEVVKQTAFNVAGISEQMGILTNSVRELKVEQAKQARSIETINNRMQNYEDRVRCDRSMAQNIRNSIHKRVQELLGIKYEDGVITDPVGLHNDKYYRPGFISRLYVDARKDSKLGTPYYETYQRDYEEVLDFIGKWVPPTGVDGYKMYLDKRRMR